MKFDIHTEYYSDSGYGYGGSFCTNTITTIDVICTEIDLPIVKNIIENVKRENKEARGTYIFTKALAKHGFKVQNTPTGPNTNIQIK